MDIGNTRSAPARGLLAHLVACALWLLAPGAVAAQGGEWPTLSGWGLEYLSATGFLQVSLSGQLDLEATSLGSGGAGLLHDEARRAPLEDHEVRCLRCHTDYGVEFESGGLEVHRLRVFADIFVGDHVYALVEVRNDRNAVAPGGLTDTRAEQLYLRVSSDRGSAGLQVGRFATPFGPYAARHLTIADPFLRAPLPYDYRTILSRKLVTSGDQEFLGWKDRPELFRSVGAPPVWGVPYQWGGLLFGAIGPFDLQFAALNRAPSSEPDAWGFDWSRFADPALVATARVTLSASLDLRGSYSRAPWMERIVHEAAPTGWVAPAASSFHQETVSVDAVYARGPMTVRAEAMLDRWEVFNVGDRPTEHIYSAEIQYDLWAGVSLATRLGYIDFRPLEDGVGGRDDWDYDVYRYEASVGYRLARNAGILLSGYRQIQRVAEDGDTHLIGGRIWWAF